MKRVLQLALGIVLTLSLAFSFSVDAASDKPKRGGTLTLAIRKDITATNPLIRTLSTEQSVRDLMFESLLLLDLQGALKPNLAESWEVSGAGKVYTFKLRRGVKFHNGQEMTAEDAKFAMDYSMNAKNGARGYERLTNVDTVEAVDKYTLRIQLKKGSAAFLYDLGAIQAFSVIPKGSLEEGVDKPNKFPPGTGPFKFVEWQPRQRLVMERFDDYWGHKAFLDRIVLKPVSSDAVRINAVRSGDVDMAERVPYEWIQQIRSGKLTGLTVAEAPYAGYYQLVMNVTAPPFDNKKLRQAIAHALDKKELIQAVYSGFGSPTDQQYPPGHDWYLKGTPAPSYDVKKARALLAEAGYDGKPIDIMIRQGDDAETAASVIQAQLKRVGINISIKLFDYTALRERIREGTFTFDYMGGSPHADPSSTYNQDFACIPDLKNRSSNYSGFCNKEIDALLEKAETELDNKKRKELIRQFLTIANEASAVVPLLFVPRFFVMRDYVKGFQTGDDGDFRAYGVGLNYTWLDK